MSLDSSFRLVQVSKSESDFVYRHVNIGIHHQVRSLFIIHEHRNARVTRCSFNDPAKQATRTRTWSDALAKRVNEIKAAP